MLVNYIALITKETPAADWELTTKETLKDTAVLEKAAKDKPSPANNSAVAADNNTAKHLLLTL